MVRGGAVLLEVRDGMKLAESTGGAEHPRIYAGDRIMRRDDDLIRKLMLDFEADDDPLLVHVPALGGDDEDERVYFHLKLLADTGFLEESGKGGGIFRMTSAGHDFCAAIRDDTIWRKTKDASASVAGVSLGVMKDIGIGYLRAKLKELGVPLA